MDTGKALKSKKDREEALCPGCPALMNRKDTCAGGEQSSQRQIEDSLQHAAGNPRSSGYTIYPNRSLFPIPQGMRSLLDSRETLCER